MRLGGGLSPSYMHCFSMRGVVGTVNKSTPQWVGLPLGFGH